MQKLHQFRLAILFSSALIPAPAFSAFVSSPALPYFEWKIENYAINEPLGGLTGDVTRSRAIAGNQSRGNCLACHLLPIPEEPYFGNLEPPLTGIGSRQSAGMIRLHVVDQSRFNPETVMPGYYRPPAQLNRAAKMINGKNLAERSGD